MAKLSMPLKALIVKTDKLGFIGPRVADIYEQIADEADLNGVGLEAWITATAATTFTMNCSESLKRLYRYASTSQPLEKQIQIAELIREIGLKCICFNGIPRTIICLESFYSSLPIEVQHALGTTARRALDLEHLPETLSAGRGLWKSIYYPFETKLAAKLAYSHPDLPVYIIESVYGALLADPPKSDTALSCNVGRVLTSILAVCCLRAQPGAGRQLISHIFGLRKAYLDGSHKSAKESDIKGGKWLATDEGSIWLLNAVDRLIEAIGNNGIIPSVYLQAQL